VKQYQAMVTASPENPLAHYGYALALTRVGNWDLAASHMKRAIEGNALATHMLQDLGRIYFHGGEYDKAIQTLSASSFGNDPEGQLYLGRTQLKLGRIAEARDTFENLVRYNQGYTQAYYYLGESSGRLGNMFSAHYNLGCFYQLKGDRKNAGFHLKRAGTLATVESEKRMVERRLEELSNPEKAKKPGSG